jgi:quercetin dioxygenase-like cupin family protein
MIVNRWEAPITPDKVQISRQYLSEGLDIFEEVYLPQQTVTEHRHPFCEVRTILEGEMLFNIAGNQFLLRAGDRVEIPANTKHTHTAQGQKSCICLVGYRAI